MAEPRGSLKPRSPTAQVRVRRVRAEGAASSEEQSNCFFVVYHQLKACSGPVEIAPVHHQPTCMSTVPGEQRAVPS